MTSHGEKNIPNTAQSQTPQPPTDTYDTSSQHLENLVRSFRRMGPRSVQTEMDTK